jgi:hypothetical protein
MGNFVWSAGRLKNVMPFVKTRTENYIFIENLLLLVDKYSHRAGQKTSAGLIWHLAHHCFNLSQMYRVSRIVAFIVKNTIIFCVFIAKVEGHNPWHTV